MKPKEFRLDKAKPTPSICPYCSVGCAIIVYTIDGRIVNIEGDPQSPHSEGCLCPKGAATLQLHYNRNRSSRVLHRKPGAKDWDEVTLDWAMNRVAELVKKTRDETFIERLEDDYRLIIQQPSLLLEAQHWTTNGTTSSKS